MSQPDRAAAADRNFVASLEKLVQHRPEGWQRQFGAVNAFVSALPFSFLNGAIIVEPPTTADLRAAIGFLDDAGFPYMIWIREGVVAEAVAAEGFRPESWSMPGMTVLPIAAPPPADGVTVRPVEGSASLEEHIAMQVASGMAEPVARVMYTASFALDPDVRIFTGVLDGRPVGGSTAIRSDDVSGVYAVGTMPEARRRGIGTAVTWAAVSAGKEWGCSLVVLQSSEMGFPLYQAMGFEVLVRYAVFRRS